MIAASRGQYASPVSPPELWEEETPEPKREARRVVEPEEEPTPLTAQSVPEPVAAPEPIDVPDPTPPASKRRPTLADIGIPPTPAKGGREHKRLQHLVRQLGQERGYRADIEDTSANGESVDVVLRKGEFSVAVEISISTNIEHELKNLRKCASLRHSRIVWVCPNEKRRESISKRLAEVGAAVPIDVIAPEDMPALLDQWSETFTKPVEMTVRGRKVRVNRKPMSPKKQAELAQAMARMMGRKNSSDGDD